MTVPAVAVATVTFVGNDLCQILVIFPNIV